MSAALPALGADPVLRLDRINSFYGPVQVHVDLTVDVGGAVCSPVPRGFVVDVAATVADSDGCR